MGITSLELDDVRVRGRLPPIGYTGTINNLDVPVVRALITTYVATIPTSLLLVLIHAHKALPFLNIHDPPSHPYWGELCLQYCVVTIDHSHLLLSNHLLGCSDELVRMVIPCHLAVLSLGRSEITHTKETKGLCYRVANNTHLCICPLVPRVRGPSLLLGLVLVVVDYGKDDPGDDGEYPPCHQEHQPYNEDHLEDGLDGVH